MINMNVDFGPQRIIDAFQKAPAVMLEHAERGLDKGAARVARAMRLEAPKAMSTLTQSVNVRKPAQLTRVISAGVDYADFVDAGTGIFGPKHTASGRMPPIQSIEDWIRVKRIQPHSKGMTEHALAFVIASGIAAKGTSKNPFAERAADSTDEAVHEDVHQQLEQGVAQVMDA